MDFCQVMHAMFPDSKLAKEISLGPNKLKYIVSHGLYPYFKDLLKLEVSKSPFVVVMFDESLNDVLQLSEMVIVLRYWDDNANRVQVRYWHSTFLGHTTHQDLLRGFEEGLSGVDMSKVIQISMDGPHTKHKFLTELRKKRSEEELNDLIDIGTCNLHTVHGSFEKGATESNWELKKVFKGSYTLFHDTPARREDFFNITASTT